ncbi:dense granule protein GRA12 [Toxoplasma gondii ARI]|uniref:Dense granule protein GRA12 n=1 Tax=Toxoplasma gondii ARI TaxID=1074872 RepID=A0A139Y2C2_TOXGO|nr:dense granule protein GRA12 [Toxoplasma gondii ARI]
MRAIMASTQQFLRPVGSRPLAGISVVVVVALAIALGTAADVGRHVGGFSGPFPMTLRSGQWRLDHGACFVGKAKNLVVDPLPRVSPQGPQPLDVTTTGSALCWWLDSMYAAHMSLKAAWERRHQEAKNRTSWLNLWRRFANWWASFPEFQIDVSVLYLDLWNDDFYGHPLPWFSAEFSYTPPSGRYAYNLFDKLQSHFASAPGTAVQEVFLLLAPAPTFNQPVEKRSSIVARAATVAAGNELFKEALGHQRVDEVLSMVPADPFRLMLSTSAFSFQAKIGDFWERGLDCMLGSRLNLRWDQVGTSVCRYMTAKASETGSGLAASFLNTVEVRVTGMDFFNHAAPVFKTEFIEGIITKRATYIPVSMYLSTDPTLTHEYEAAKTVKRAVQAGRVGAALARGLVNFARATNQKADESHEGQTKTPTSGVRGSAGSKHN